VSWTVFITGIVAYIALCFVAPMQRDRTAAWYGATAGVALFLAVWSVLAMPDPSWLSPAIWLVAAAFWAFFWRRRAAKLRTVTRPSVWTEDRL
jgi:hypothetical protein